MGSDYKEQLDAALSELDAAAGQLDDMFATQAKLTITILRSAAMAAAAALNPRAVVDLEFALNDAKLLADDLPASDRDAFAPPLQKLGSIVDGLRAEAALPAALVERIHDLRNKLKERKHAIEREQYRPPETAAEPLPHEPGSLVHDARVIAEQLREAGFETPELDALLEHPDTVYLSDVTHLIEELDVVLG